MKRLNPLGDSASDICVLAHNTVVDIDHQGQMAHVNRGLARVFGGGWQRSKNAPLINWVVATYEKTRAKSQHPLRKKTISRFKHLPAVGPLKSFVKQVFRARGINPKNVQNAMVYRHKHGGYSVHFTELVPRRERNDKQRLSRVVHKGRVQDIGLCVTPTGLDIVITQADGKKDLLRKVAVEDLITPGFAQDLYRHVIAPKANTVALDETFVPRLSGALRDANAQIRRWLRSRQAVGAIEFAVVSPVSREIEDALVVARRANVSKGTQRLMKTLNVQKCPCGAPADLRLDPVTLIPVLRRTKCVECGAVMDTGHVLATRASAYVLDNWRTYGHAGVPARI
jgi:hypothetical protein